MDNEEIRKLEETMRYIDSRTENQKPFLKLEDLKGHEFLRLIRHEVLSPEEQEQKKNRGSKIRMYIAKEVNDGELEYIWETSFGIFRQIAAFILRTKCIQFTCKKCKDKVVDANGKKLYWKLHLVPVGREEE